MIQRYGCIPRVLVSGSSSLGMGLCNHHKKVLIENLAARLRSAIVSVTKESKTGSWKRPINHESVNQLLGSSGHWWWRLKSGEVAYNGIGLISPLPFSTFLVLPLLFQSLRSLLASTRGRFFGDYIALCCFLLTSDTPDNAISRMILRHIIFLIILGYQCLRRLWKFISPYSSSPYSCARILSDIEAFSISQLLGRSLFCLGLLVRYGKELTNNFENRLALVTKCLTLLKRFLVSEDFGLKVRSLQVTLFTLSFG